MRKREMSLLFSCLFFARLKNLVVDDQRKKQRTSKGGRLTMTVREKEEYERVGARNKVRFREGERKRKNSTNTQTHTHTQPQNFVH